MSAKNTENVPVDVMDLALPQLMQLKQQLNNELELLGSSINQLKIAQTKFQSSRECTQNLSAESAGPKSVMIPLTDSMYVPGELEDASKVLLDIGTGYFIEKEIPAAKDYFGRKIKHVTNEMEKLQNIAKEKMLLRDIVTEAVERKIQAAVAAQQITVAGKS